MKQVSVLLLASLLLAPSCDEATPEPKDPVDLIPLDQDISGWARSGDMDVAENASQLYALIDGEGEVYIEYGFVKCAFQDFEGELSGGTVLLTLRVYDVGDTANARAVYEDSRVNSGLETPWTDGPGDAARIDESPLFAYELEFRADRFYIWLTIGEKSDGALNIARLFALNVSAGIEDGG